MSLIADSNDPSGYGMFSRQGRKLNKLFINLSREARRFHSRPRATEQSENHKLREKKAKETGKKEQYEPFSLMVSREALERIGQNSRIVPLCDNLCPKSSYKVKVLANLKSGRATQPISEAVSIMKCPRFKSLSLKSEPAANKTHCLIDFNKRSGRKEVAYKTSPEFDLNVLQSFNCTRPTEKSSVWYQRSLISNVDPRPVLQRNNYALNVRKDLIEKRTVLNVPIFDKQTSHPRLVVERPLAPLDCPFIVKPRSHVQTIDFRKTKARLC